METKVYFDEFAFRNIPTVELNSLDCEPSIKLNIGETYYLGAKINKFELLKLKIKVNAERKLEYEFYKKKRA